MAVAERVGAQEARIAVIPDGDEHPRWGEVVAMIEALGVELDPWQMKVLWASLLRRNDKWAAFTVAVCAPRQNGKNGILELRELVGALLLNEKLLIHSAHLADTSKEGFRRLEDLIDTNDWLAGQVGHIWRTNGHESIEFTNGNRIRFRTRTRGGGRGFSGSPVIFDEAMFLPEISMGAILPVIAAQPDPQVWYMGSAVDQMIHDDGIAFTRVRERALAGEDDRLAYFEWSLDAESPDAVESEEATDPEAWAATNPALGIRIMEDYVAAEYLELDERTFAVERLGVGDWPDTNMQALSAIDVRKWDALVDEGSELPGQVALAFDVSPDRGYASISAAGPRPDRLQHVEIVDHGIGTGWLVPRIAELVDELSPVGVLCDSIGPASSLVDALEKVGVRVTMLNASEYARACGHLFDSVEQSGLRHTGSSELRQAVKGAAKRPLGDAWAWSRKNSGVDISPLVACTFALWGAATVKRRSWRPVEEPVAA